jgi:hypothetical protein
MPQQRAFCRREAGLLAGLQLRAGQDMRRLLDQGEGELVAIGESRGVVGLELGGFALEGGVEGRELRDGFLGQSEILRANLDADSTFRALANELDLSLQAPQC